ncbi:MAG: helix-turn-helix domain-containing protein [Proteobacteria bacterium]|nr:helix-turn-helix domain-containing protein [Pseudomonadota bacterium]
MKDLIPVEDKDQTPLRALTVWVIYRLMRQGKLHHVKVGRRRYLTESGIAEFLAAGGEIKGAA